jgi:hypothetical protein
MNFLAGAAPARKFMPWQKEREGEGEGEGEGDGAQGGLKGRTVASWWHLAASRDTRRPHGLHGGLTGRTAASRVARRPHGALGGLTVSHGVLMRGSRRPHVGNRRPHVGNRRH